MDDPRDQDQGGNTGEGGDNGAAPGTTAPLGGDDAGAAAGAGAASGKPASKGDGKGGKKDRGQQQDPADAPAWQKPDYTGGLTIEQAEWRNAHLTQKRFKAG